MKWDTQPVPHALARFSTNMKVPAFKFKRVHDLQKNVSGSKKKLFEGIASFFKEADCYDGTFTVLSSPESDLIDIWVSVGGKKWGKEAGVPKHVKQGTDQEMGTIEAIAILPRESAVFKGILKCDIQKFINTAQLEGAAWRR